MWVDYRGSLSTVYNENQPVVSSEGTVIIIWCGEKIELVYTNSDVDR